MSRDYEAGYRDGSIHYELEHCSACKNVADLQEALAENARLRGERDMYRYLVGCMVQLGIPYQSAAENAKLRECLQDLAEHIREDDGFGLDYGWMLDRMRELGVEVDDG